LVEAKRIRGGGEWRGKTMGEEGAGMSEGRNERREQ